MRFDGKIKKTEMDMKRRGVPGKDYDTVNDVLSEALTRVVGSTFVARGKDGGLETLRVEAGEDCEGCWYDTNSLHCGAHVCETGFCDSKRRLDYTSVRFVKEV